MFVPILGHVSSDGQFKGCISYESLCNELLLRRFFLNFISITNNSQTVCCVLGCFRQNVHRMLRKRWLQSNSWRSSLSDSSVLSRRIHMRTKSGETSGIWPWPRWKPRSGNFRA